MKRTISVSDRVYRRLVERDRQLSLGSVSQTAELLIESALADIQTGVLVDPELKATRRLLARDAFTEGEIVQPDEQPMPSRVTLTETVCVEDYSDLMTFGE